MENELEPKYVYDMLEPASAVALQKADTFHGLHPAVAERRR